jgi:dihydrofolate reductase
MTVRLSIIAAVAENGVIGRDGDMPWKLSTDLKRFKALTTGKPVVMGRKTFASIGRPLPNRVNIVVTRDGGFKADGVSAVSDLDAALAAAGDADEVMVIGGGEIYRAWIAKADRLYITHVAASPEGDTLFPAIDPAQWVELSSEDVPEGPSDSAASRFVVYARRGS